MEVLWVKGFAWWEVLVGLRVLVKNLSQRRFESTPKYKASSFATGHFHQDGATLEYLSATVLRRRRRYSKENTSAPPSRSGTKIYPDARLIAHPSADQNEERS